MNKNRKVKLDMLLIDFKHQKIGEFYDEFCESRLESIGQCIILEDLLDKKGYLDLDNIGDKKVFKVIIDMLEDVISTYTQNNGDSEILDTVLTKKDKKLLGIKDEPGSFFAGDVSLKVSYK